MSDGQCPHERDMPKQTELYAYVVGGAVHEAGSLLLCVKRAQDSGMDPEKHVFRFVLDKDWRMW